ncbi:MAG: energy transducer TonB [Sphingomicrobium sp.]
MVGAMPPPVVLEPSSQWVIDYAPNSCRLIRTFGDAANKTVLMMESEVPYEMDMLIVGKPLKGNADEVFATFLPKRGEPIKGGTAKASESGAPAVLWPHVHLVAEDAPSEAAKKAARIMSEQHIRPPAVDLAEKAKELALRQEFAAKTSAVKVDTDRRRSVLVSTGSLAAPIKMLDECSRLSLKDWGVDPDLEDKVVRPVWNSSSTPFLKATDYPKRMLEKGAESEVKARLLVDASGKVTKCTSLSHFDAPEFNAIVCDALMKRARYEPAELADGTKVPSYNLVRIVFRMH